jgi:sugar lactone lactonase YvrE
LFVTNVLNGTVAAAGGVVNRGTVVRVDLGFFGSQPLVLDETVIGSGFPERTDPSALVIGPTGVGIGPSGKLYVADTLSNRIAAIDNPFFRFSSAGTGKTISTGGALNGPLGLAMAPNGDIVTTNGGDGNAVETTPSGTQVAVVNADDTGAGAGTLFGLAVAPGGKGLYLVNDGNNMLDLLH